LRLFRTPSLPYRLKFRQVSDLTPSKKSSTKPPASLISTPTPASLPTVEPQKEKSQPLGRMSIFRRSERNVLDKKSRDLKYIEKLTVDIASLNIQIKALESQNVEKITEINDLNCEIESMKVAEEFLEKIANQAIDKINKSDEKVKEILQNYDVLLHHMDRMNCENDKLLILNDKLQKSNDEFMKISEERLREMEKILKIKCEDLHKMKTKLIEKNNLMKSFEFELGKKTMENYELSMKLEKSEEGLKIFEVSKILK
jgi:chromosome segregation ATPase